MYKLKHLFFFCFIVFLVQTQPGIYSVDTCCDTNQIQVSGEGRASGQPDVAYIRIRFREQAKTSP